MRHKLLLVVTFSALASCASTRTDHVGANAPRAAQIVPLKSGRPLVALALGGGGARGFAHVGVIKALEDAGIVPDIIAGASSGAVVAALYASGMNAGTLAEIASGIDQASLVDFTLFGSGWVRGRALQDFVNRAVDNRPIEKLAKPFAVVVTRARDGAMKVFNRGDTGLAVRASSSVPNLFIPPLINGEEYIDGGLTSPVPVAVARAMGADIVIAVDVSWFAQARLDGAYAAPADSSSVRGSRYERLTHELADADILITPRTVRARMLDFDHKLENIAAGEEAARAALPRVEEIIAKAAADKRHIAPARVRAQAVTAE